MTPALITASGAIGTILAGLIAWAAVERQIANEKMLQTRREEETYQVIQAELSPYLGTYHSIWRVIDRSIRFRGGDELVNGVALARTISPYKPPFEAIDKAGHDLSPLRRRQLIDVLNAMQGIERKLQEKYGQEGDENVVGRERDRHAMLWLHSVRAYFTHLENYLRKFDSAAADRFADSAKGFCRHKGHSPKVPTTSSGVGPRRSPSRRGRAWPSARTDVAVR